MSFKEFANTAKVGESFVVPWAETDKMGLGRPKCDAIVTTGGKTFRLARTDEGIRMERVK